MIPKQYKLKSDSDIAKVFKNGKTVKSSFLFLRFASNDLENSRAAFSIGLKYSKKAVDRNRAKRVLRSACAELLNQIKPGFDLVFYFDKNFQDKITPKEILEPMKTCLIRANLLK